MTCSWLVYSFSQFLTIFLQFVYDLQSYEFTKAKKLNRLAGLRLAQLSPSLFLSFFTLTNIYSNIFSWPYSFWTKFLSQKSFCPKKGYDLICKLSKQNKLITIIKDNIQDSIKDNIRDTLRRSLRTNLRKTIRTTLRITLR